MKNTMKLALAATALAAATSANAAYNSYGDLLVGFAGTSATHDTIIDIGQVSSLQNGETWSVGANLGAQFGVVGITTSTAKLVYATSAYADENSYSPFNTYNLTAATVKTIAQSLTSAPGSNTRTTSITDTTGWTYQTDQPAGTPGTTFQNNFFNPNVDASSTAYLFANNGSSTAAGGTVTSLGYFNYDAAKGILTYSTGEVSAVPEPGVYGAMAGLSVLVLAVRRQFAKA